MLAIVPLANAMGTATEEIALRIGPGIGGLLNATFGKATELIIAFLALNAGLYKVVQASISGSIIGNALFVLGLAMFLGGWKYPTQTFNRTVAGLNISMLTWRSRSSSTPELTVTRAPARGPALAVGALRAPGDGPASQLFTGRSAAGPSAAPHNPRSPTIASASGSYRPAEA